MCRTLILTILGLLFAFSGPAQASGTVVPVPPAWKHLFPPGFSFDIPKQVTNERMIGIKSLNDEKLRGLRRNEDGSVRDDKAYLEAVATILASVSSDDVLRYGSGRAERINYDERQRFFLDTAWAQYSQYVVVQKKRLMEKPDKLGERKAVELSTILRPSPESRHLTIDKSGRGSFAFQAARFDGNGDAYVPTGRVAVQIDFVTDKASPDIIISNWSIKSIDGLQPLFKTPQ